MLRSVLCVVLLVSLTCVLALPGAKSALGTAPPPTGITSEPRYYCRWKYNELCNRSECTVGTLFAWRFCCYPWNRHPLCTIDRAYLEPPGY